MSELNIPLTVVDNNQVVGMEVGAGVINAVSPTVDLERVSTPNPGVKVTVKDVRGEHSETVLDGPAVDPSVLIDDTSAAANKVWSAHKSDDEISSVKGEIPSISPERFGAKGDGVTDDSAAIQAAVDAGYEICFKDNKTYYLASTVTINHDIRLIGGKNTVIKTKTPSGGTVNDGIVVAGTLKKTTTLTSNYSAKDATVANSRNRFKLADMTDIDVGDIMVITAEDQYYHYNREYYYLGGTLLIAEKDDEYLYTADAMPWDITNTEDVSVKVYSAPTAIIENLHFESDLDSVGTYHYCVMFDRCKNSVIRNCTISEMDNGFRAWECVNLLVDGLNVAKTPARVGTSDHYGVALYACNNSVISRVVGECANSCVDLSGHTPNMNTYIKHCCLLGSNRVDGLGMHENAYNTVIEDCVLGGMIGYGTVTVRNCRFIQRNKQPESDVAISFRGSHRPEFSRLIVENCIIEGDNLAIGVLSQYPQRPIQTYDNVISEIIIRDCVGGKFFIIHSANETVLSNTIQRIIIDNWQNCLEIYKTDTNTIESILVKNCSFIEKYWINKHNDAIFNNGIHYMRKINFNPQEDKLFVNDEHGGQYYLESGDKIDFASSDASARCVVCGKNIVSNKPTDYAVGGVSGSVGNVINRTVNSNFSSSVSVNGDGEIVFTQPSNSTATNAIYPVCMMYVKNPSMLKASCKLKNTGGTDGASFRMVIAIIDAKTGLVTYRAEGSGSSAKATLDGAVVTHSRQVNADSIVMVYLYCYSAVAGSETTFADYVAELMPFDEIKDLAFEQYNGSTRIGDGSIDAVDGLNNIGTNASAAVSVKFNANLL